MSQRRCPPRRTPRSCFTVRRAPMSRPTVRLAVFPSTAACSARALPCLWTATNWRRPAPTGWTRPFPTRLRRSLSRWRCIAALPRSASLRRPSAGPLMRARGAWRLPRVVPYAPQGALWPAHSRRTRVIRWMASLPSPAIGIVFAPPPCASTVSTGSFPAAKSCLPAMCDSATTWATDCAWGGIRCKSTGATTIRARPARRPWPWISTTLRAICSARATASTGITAGPPRREFTPAIWITV